MSENRLKLLELIDLMTLHHIMISPKKEKKRKTKMNSIIKSYKMSKFCIYVLKHM